MPSLPDPEPPPALFPPHRPYHRPRPPPSEHLTPLTSPITQYPAVLQHDNNGAESPTQIQHPSAMVVAMQAEDPCSIRYEAIAMSAFTWHTSNCETCWYSVHTVCYWYRPARAVAEQGASQGVRDFAFNLCSPVVILSELARESRCPI